MPLNLTPPKTVDFSQVSTVKNVNLGNQYGVGGQRSSSFGTSGTSNNTSGVSTNTPVDMNNPAVQAQAVSTASAGQHGPLYNSRIQTGVQNMVDAHNRGQRFNSQFQTISNPTDNALNYSNGQFWDTNNSAMGPRSLAHSGYQLNIGTGQYNFGDDRIGRKLLGARRSDGTIDTTKLGRRSMRRLRNVMSSQFQQPAQDMQQGNQQVQQQSNSTTPVNLSQKFPNLFPQGFSFNQFGIQTPFQFNQNSALSTQQQQAPVQPATENPAARSERFNTNQQFGQMFTNYDKYGNGESWSDYLKRVQKALVEAGYDVGSTGADGMWGNNTSTAWGNFIRDHNAIDGENTITNLLSGKYKAETPSDRSTYTGSTSQQPLLPRIKNFVSSLFSAGGVLKAAYGSQIKAKTSQTPALDAIMNNPQLAEQFLAALSQQMGKEITIDQLSAAAADPEMGQELEVLAQQMMKRAARHGAKLEYVSILRGKCPSGQELVYFAKGGKICSACMGKKLENGGEPGYMKSFRDRQKKKQMEKCGGKMKKGK